MSITDPRFSLTAAAKSVAADVIRLAEHAARRKPTTPEPASGQTVELFPKGPGCPFCGDDDPQIDEVDTGVFAVVCQTCLCVGPVSDVSPHDAAELWATRHTEGAP